MEAQGISLLGNNANTRVETRGPLAGASTKSPPQDPNVSCTACKKAGYTADNCLHHFQVEALGQDSITHS